jgi:hypothetical protein
MPASDWSDLCPDTIVWEQKTTRDQYAKPSYAAPVTFTGRRVFEEDRVSAFSKAVKGEGAEVISSSTIWILADIDISYEDRVYVQGDTIFPPILKWQKYPDEVGDKYTKVYLGNANG